MKRILKLYCMLVAWGSFANGANILYISLTPSPSHHIWDRTLALALREKHHNIVFATHSEIKSRENFTVIYFEGIYDKINLNYDYVTTFKNKSKYEEIEELHTWIDNVSLWDLETKGLRELLKVIDSNIQFDLIIFDMTTAHYLYPIIDKLNIPVIAISQFGIAPYFTNYFGNDLHISYIPIYLFPYTNQMSFFERLNNWFYTNVFLIYRHYYYMPIIKNRSQKLFGTNIKPYYETEKRVDLLLANFDHVLDFPQSLPPAIIPVGGLHVKREKSLSEDLKKILDEAEHGVILFCLGTNFKSSTLQLDQKNALIQGLGRFKQIILWKYENEITNLPKNFVIRTWVPQNDILAHPNVKVFVTHGGALSTQEAMYHGVPVVSMPFFADQILNTRKMVSRYLGQQLNYGQLTADIVFKTVSEVLNNPLYKRNSADLSRRYRDQPEDALTRAIWWIEFTIRQNGAQHLSITARDQPIYVKYLLDIWGLVIAVTVLPIIILIKYICLKKKSQTQKKKSD